LNRNEEQTRRLRRSTWTYPFVVFGGFEYTEKKLGESPHVVVILL
jgi:hypothetical protein